MWKIDNGTNTGMTTAFYTNALDWMVSELGQKTMLLKNTHGSLSLMYKLHGYACEGGIARAQVTETTPEAGEIAEFHYELQWHRLVLQVKDGSGHSTYTIDYEGQGV